MSEFTLPDGWRHVPGKGINGAQRTLKTVSGSYGLVRQAVAPYNWAIVYTGCMRSIPGPRWLRPDLTLTQAAEALEKHVQHHVRNLAKEVG